VVTVTLKSSVIQNYVNSGLCECDVVWVEIHSKTLIRLMVAKFATNGRSEKALNMSKTNK